jgi:hypothetical protein
MANETTEILRIVFDASDAIKKTADLKAQRDALKQSNKELAKAEGDNTIAITQNEAAIKALDTAIARNNKQTQLLIQQNTAAKGSYEQLLRQQQLAEINLKNAEGLLKRNADGTVEFTQAYFDAAKQVDQAKEAILLFNSGISQGAQNVGNYGNTLEGLRARLEDLRKNLQTIDVNSEEFKRGSDEAANLALKIDQVSGKVDEFGNREPKNPAKKAFEDTLATAGALTSALELASLASDENGEVNESVAKSLKSIAIAQQVANIVKEKGAILDTADLIRTKAITIAKGAYAAVTRVVTLVTKQFGITAAAAWAAATLGISVLITGIVELIANFDAITNAVKSFFGIEQGLTEEQIALKNQQINQLAKQEEMNARVSESAVKGIDREIAIAKSQGKNTTDLEIKKQKAIIATSKASLESARQQIKLLSSLGKLSDDQLEKYNAAIKAIDENKEKIKDAEAGITVIENTEATKRAEKAEKDAEERQRKIKEANDKAKAERERYNESIKNLDNEFNLDERQKLAKQFDDKIKIIQGKSDAEKALREKIKAEQTKALEKFDEDQAAKEAENLTKRNLALLAIEEDSLENRLKVFDENFKRQADELRKQGNTEEEIERIKQANITDIKQQAAIENINEQASLNDVLLQNELAAVDNSVAAEEEKARQKAEINLKYLNLQLQNAKELANADNTLTDIEKANIEKIRLAIIGAQNEIKTLQESAPPKTIGEVFGATKKDADEIDANIQGATEAFANLIGVINAGYQQQIDAINEKRDFDIQAINDSTLSEEEKKKKIEQLNKDAAQKAYQLQVKQFNADKALKLVTATIDIASAIIKNSFNPILAAITAGVGFAQLAIIASQKPPAPPKFADGVIGLKGAGNATSDSIPAMLSNGESVITASGTRYAEMNYPGLLQFLNTKNKFADGVVNFNQPNVRPDQVNIGEQIRLALQDLTIVTKVSDIEKASFDRQQVRTVGVI